LTSYENIERLAARKRLNHIIREAERFNIALFEDGSAVAVADPILDGTSLDDLVKLAHFAGVDLKLNLTKPSPLEQFTRGVWHEG